MKRRIAIAHLAGVLVGFLAGAGVWATRTDTPAPLQLGVISPAPAIYRPTLAAPPQACRPGRPCLVLHP